MMTHTVPKNTDQPSRSHDPNVMEIMIARNLLSRDPSARFTHQL
jgi:hypothetical protein